jgi:hypothetical protein
MKKNLLLLPLMALLFCASIQGQTAISASGGNAESTDGSLSYTIGQVFYKEATDSNFTVNAGVQQAFEISEVLSITNPESNFSITLYPNPATDFINITLNGDNNLSANYSLIDLNGRTINSGKIDSLNKRINISELESATYLLTLITTDNQIKTYKILKN